MKSIYEEVTPLHCMDFQASNLVQGTTSVRDNRHTEYIVPTMGCVLTMFFLGKIPQCMVIANNICKIID